MGIDFNFKDIDTVNSFINQFEKWGLGNVFTRGGFIALFEYLADIENVDYSDEVVMWCSVINLSDDWKEYADINEYNAKNGTAYEDAEELDDDGTNVLYIYDSRHTAFIASNF